jgi:hypothetical protein
MSRRKRPQPSLFDSTSAAVVADIFDPVRLTQARILAGMTKQELAETLGVSPAAVGLRSTDVRRSGHGDHVNVQVVGLSTSGNGETA